jgi:hypothetical protein
MLLLAQREREDLACVAAIALAGAKRSADVRSCGTDSHDTRLPGEPRRKTQRLPNASVSAAGVATAGEAGEVDPLVVDLGIAIDHRRVFADRHPQAAAYHRQDRDVLRDPVVGPDLESREFARDRAARQAALEKPLDPSRDTNWRNWNWTSVRAVCDNPGPPIGGSREIFGM